MNSAVSSKSKSQSNGINSSWAGKAQQYVLIVILASVPLITTGFWINSRWRQVLAIPHELALGVINPGSEHKLNITLHNQLFEDVRVIGVNDRCDRNGCSMTVPIPNEITGGSKATLTTAFRAPKQIGPFDLELSIYTTSERSPTVICHISGQVVANPAGTNSTR